MTHIQRSHKFPILFFHLSGVCDVCKKEVTASRAISSTEIKPSAIVDNYQFANARVLQDMLTHRCPGPAMEVPRTYDGRIEVQPEARDSSE